MPGNQPGHLKHADLLFAVEHGLQILIGIDEVPLFGVLQPVLADCRPKAFSSTRSREGIFHPRPGLHPNEADTWKTTALLLNFFKTNEGTSRWFLKPGEKAQVRPLPK
jgi:hypothetical protein